MPITREQLAEILKRLVPVPDQMGPGTSIPSQGPVPENLFPVEKMGTLPQGLPDLMPDATNAPDPAIPGDHSTRNKILALLGGVGGVGLGAALGGKNFMGGLAQGIQPIPGIIMQNRRMKEATQNAAENRKAVSDRVLQTDKLATDRIVKQEELRRGRPLTETEKTDLERKQFQLGRVKEGKTPDPTAPTKESTSPKGDKPDVTPDGKHWAYRDETGKMKVESIPAEYLGAYQKKANIPGTAMVKMSAIKTSMKYSDRVQKMLDDKTVRGGLGRIAGSGTMLESWFTGKATVPTELRAFMTAFQNMVIQNTIGRFGARSSDKELALVREMMGSVATSPDALKDTIKELQMGSAMELEDMESTFEIPEEKRYKYKVKVNLEGL